MNDATGIYLLVLFAFLMGLLTIPILVLLLLLWLSRFSKTNKIKKAINWHDGEHPQKKNR